MKTQLRRYVVADDGLDVVVKFFAEVKAVREAFGFTVLFAVVDRERNEFSWAVSHPDWDDAVERFERSDERKTLHADRSMPIVSRTISMVEVLSD